MWSHDEPFEASTMHYFLRKAVALSPHYEPGLITFNATAFHVYEVPLCMH